MQRISLELLNNITSRIVNAIHPDKIILFGSHAWGKPSKDSDIDLLVILEHSNQPSYRRAREVYRSLRGLKIPVEVLVRTSDEVARGLRVKTSLERKILDDGMVLHE